MIGSGLELFSSNTFRLDKGGSSSPPNRNSELAAQPAAPSKSNQLQSDKVTLGSGSDGNLETERQNLAKELSESESRQVSQLVARDAEVRAHERAHKAVGGRYAGAISYVFQQGPDGKRYAVGGEVSIDTSAVRGDPQATIDKMNVVKAAALAPSDPSAQDRRVATEAQQAISSARVELRQQQQDQRLEEQDEGASSSTLRINERKLESYNSVSTLNTEEDPAQQFIDDLA